MASIYIYIAPLHLTFNETPWAPDVNLTHIRRLLKISETFNLRSVFRGEDHGLKFACKHGLHESNEHQDPFNPPLLHVIELR